jgi:hypothetical protein
VREGKRPWPQRGMGDAGPSGASQIRPDRGECSDRNRLFLYISLGWGGFKAPQRVYQPQDGSSHPSLLSPSRLCESSSSNSVQTSAYVHAWTLLGLLLTSALRHYSDSGSRPRSDTPRTPTHVRTRTLLGHPLMSVLGRYSDSCSLPRSDSTRNPTLAVLSIRLSAILYSHIPTSLGAPCLSMLRVLGTPLGRSAQVSARTSVSQFVLQVRARAFGPRSDLHPCPHYNPNPCHPTLLRGPLGHPLGHPCLAPSYEFEPVPSGPARTSIIVRVTSAARIQTARNICPTYTLFFSKLYTL